MAQNSFGLVPGQVLCHVQNIPPRLPQFPVEPPPSLPLAMTAEWVAELDQESTDVDDPEPTKKSAKRREQRLALQLFLQEHGFAGVNAPRKPKRRLIPRPSCLFSQQEVLYPVHVAAQQADVLVLDLLLRSGAKMDQRTSKGRTPLEFAAEALDVRLRMKAMQILRSSKILVLF